MRRSLIVLLVAAGLLTAPAALADVTRSSNWAGYAVHGATFGGAEAEWTEPSVACVPGRASFSAVWVGIGGFSLDAPALEQVGTEEDCSGAGAVVSSAWYELVPAASQPVAMPVSPGHRMYAAVQVQGHRVTLTLADLTTGRRFTRVLNAPTVDDTSAEWIVEAPSDCSGTGDCRTLPLADFRSVRFSDASAQGSGGHVGPVADPRWRSTQILLWPEVSAGAAGARSARRMGIGLPSALRSGGSAFTVAYGAAAEVARELAALARLSADRRAGRETNRLPALVS